MTRTLLAVAAFAVWTAGCTTAPGWHVERTGSEPVARNGDVAPLRAMVEFARSPTDATWSAVPFADEVYLGLGSDLRGPRSAAELRDPRSWKLNPRGRLFRAGVGPFSALELLAGQNRPLAFSVGPHRHCVSPPVAPPPEVVSLRRISVQPRKVEAASDGSQSTVS